jgi:hypothetical protein
LIDPPQEWKQQRLIELELGFGIPPLLRFVPLILTAPIAKNRVLAPWLFFGCDGRQTLLFMSPGGDILFLLPIPR